MCYLFYSEEELDDFLKKVTAYEEARAVAGSLEARLAPSAWIQKALKKATEISDAKYRTKPEENKI